MLWLHASTAERLENDVKSTLEELQVPGRRDTGANPFELLRNWLRDARHGPWLLILDNVDDAKVVLNKPSGSRDGTIQGRRIDYIPPCVHGSVLVTSRYRSEALKIVRDRDIVQVKPMDEKQAINMMENRLDLKYDKDELLELVLMLSCMPLALSQAAAYINRRAPQCSIPEYLKKLTDSATASSSVFDEEQDEMARDREARNSIMATLLLSLDHVLQVRKSAADVLSLMSFFDRQAIPEDLLCMPAKPRSIGWLEMLVQFNLVTAVLKWLPISLLSTTDSRSASAGQHALGSPPVWDDARPHEQDITLLKDYSLISVNLDRKTFEMHRLVQFAVQRWLQDQKGQTSRWQRHFVGIMLSAFPEHHDIHEKGSVCQALLPHAMMAIGLPLRAAESPLLEQQSRLTVRCAHHAWFMGAYFESERLAGKALAASEQSLGTDHMTTIEAMARMAHAQVKLRKYDQAEKLQLQIVDRHRSILGEGHNKTLDAMVDLGWTYHHQGRSEEGKMLQEQTLSAMRKTLPDSDRVVLSTMNNLAATYSELGRLSEAEQLQQEVVSNCKTVFGAHHNNTLASMYVLAQIYTRQEYWSKAEELLREVLEGTKTALGERHVDTIKTMMLLATTLRPLGRKRSALFMLTSCVDQSTSVLGASDPVTVRRRELLEAWRCEHEGSAPV